MPQLVFLPHAELCPDGAVIEAKVGETILDVALRSGINIEHACEKSCACTTCHVIVREGFDELEPSEELEDDMLDKAWGLEPESRLSCQAKVVDSDMVIDIPKYTINMVSENN
ncbi:MULTISPECIES: ISC system 2Fe-2S type ferredoxin [Shewanella]|uniref:2Fe-2S ferredoxin n=1 Tax=Shewanella salipaludis TaxID=2723052 RepID=A0A972G4P2_9GAMM|nr:MULTISPECIES: ISC system 2Fe-2S type ferredoxin [Shewanella]MCE9684925.1 ISC system 2Fe-2S type ferredoxin [Shewanella sp. AS16]NMH64380.1 ISC system 2Fe-2S type ferredoxin [Shewanella salipaludis]